MANDSIAIGTVVADTFEVTGQLGKGGMGAVFAANHRRLPGKRVAIKVLLGTETDAQGLARFRREAEIASRLGHPNIVDVLDFNTLPDGTPYQVLEYLDGESLGARLRRGPVSLAETQDWLRQMGSALAAAHAQGIVHRDLKPENIFLCPTDSGGRLGVRVKLLDFGISKIRGSQTLQTQEQVLIGTPQYMSPEQAHGENHKVDQRTDVFALGAIAYEMLSGRAAFAGDSVVSVILNVVQKEPTPLATLAPGLPGSVGTAIARALAKDPEARFPDVASFIEALTGQPLVTRASLGAAAVAATLPGTASGAPVHRTAPPGADAYAHTVVPATGTSAIPGVAADGGVSPSLATVPPAAQAIASPTAKPSAQRSRPFWLLALAGATLAGGGAFVALRGSADRAEAPVPAAPAVALPAPVLPALVASAPSAAPAAPQPAPRPNLAQEPARPETPPGEDAPRRPMRGAASASTAGSQLAPEVEAEVAQAEAALARGDLATATRLARHSLLGGKSSRAFLVLTLAACKASDLTNARAHFVNLSPADRGRARRGCKEQGIDL